MNSSSDEFYETGNEIIDDQHRKLIGFIDELSEIDVKPIDEILRLLDELSEYMLTHFLSEEELMTEVQYPADATKEMIKQHDEFKSYVRLRILEFRHDGIFNVQVFLLFLKNFLKDHEMGLDQLLADWIRRQNETSQAA